MIFMMKAAPGVDHRRRPYRCPARLVVLDLDDLGGRRDLYANPEILWSSPDTMEHTEGSVSMPGATETVTRPRVDIRYRDLAGIIHEERLEGFSRHLHAA